MLQLLCDKCGAKFDSPKLYGIPASPYSNALANSNTGADVSMPDGWQRVMGRHLCGVCTTRLGVFLKEKP